MGNLMKHLTNPLNAIPKICRAIVLLVVVGNLSATWAQPSILENEQVRSALGSTGFTQEYKIDDTFLVKNNELFSLCTKRAAGVTSKILTCLSASAEKLDAYLSRLMIRKKLGEKAIGLFFENRKSSCLKIGDDFDGSNQEVVYADCLRMRTVEEIIKKSHSVEDIDEFLLLLMMGQKISLIEQEKFFNSRNTFCADATKFRSDFLEKKIQDEGFYKNCIRTRTIEEILKKLY